MMEKVQACEAIIHHGFNDPHLCWEALQVAGSGVNHSGTHRIPNGNKRLAVVGDAVIDLILSEDWFESGANECDSPDLAFPPRLCAQPPFRLLDRYTNARLIQRQPTCCGNSRGPAQLYACQSQESRLLLSEDHGHRGRGSHRSCFS